MRINMRTIEEYKTQNREARTEARKRMAEQIADRITPVNCQTVIEIADEIKELALGIQRCKEHDVKVHFMTINELQNHIRELQAYLVLIEENARGMHD